MGSDAGTQEKRWRWWQTMLVLALCLALRGAAELVVYQSGFRSLGDDDFSKMSVSLRWAANPRLFPHAIWLPFAFWSVGTAARFVPSVYTAAIVTNTLFGAACLVMFYLWVRNLFGDLAAAAAGIILAVFPWHVWLSLTPPGETAFLAMFIAALFFLFRWHRRGRDIGLWAASVALLASNSVRFHGWMLSGLFVVYILARLYRRPEIRPKAGGLVCAALLPFLFPAAFMLWQWGDYGTPTHFLQSVGDTWMQLYGAHSPMPVRFVSSPALVFLSGPILAVLALAGLVRFLRTARSDRALFVWLAFGYLGLLCLAAAGARVETRYAPQRYVMPVLMMMTALAGWRIAAWWRRRKVVAVAALAVLLAWQAASCFRYPRAYSTEHRVARYLNELWDAGALGANDRVVVLDRLPYAGRTIAILSRGPRRFLCRDNLLEAFPPQEKFKAPTGTLPGDSHDEWEARQEQWRTTTRQWLADQHIGAVLITLKESGHPRATKAPHIEDFMQQYASICGYKIFVPKGQQLPPAPEPAPARDWRSTTRAFDHVPVCEGTRLVGCQYADGKFSKEVIVQWQLQGEGTSDKVHVFAVNVRRGIRLRLSDLKINGGFARPTRPPFTRTDVISLQIGRVEYAGQYELLIRCPDESQQPVKLGDFYLMSSKRDAFLQFFRGDRSAWRLALSMLLTQVT